MFSINNTKKKAKYKIIFQGTLVNKSDDMKSNGEIDRITRVSFHPLMNPIITPMKNVAKY
jgi:hypothetical protein